MSNYIVRQLRKHGGIVSISAAERIEVLEAERDALQVKADDGRAIVGDLLRRLDEALTTNEGEPSMHCGGHTPDWFIAAAAFASDVSITHSAAYTAGFEAAREMAADMSANRGQQILSQEIRTISPSRRKAAMSEKPELLPCPFCGGEAVIEQYGDNRKSTIVSCTECACRLENGESFRHGTIWNTRPAPVAEVKHTTVEQAARVLLEGDALSNAVLKVTGGTRAHEDHLKQALRTLAGGGHE